MSSSWSRSWAFWFLALDFTHLRRAFAAFATVSGLTLEREGDGERGFVAAMDEEGSRSAKTLIRVEMVVGVKFYRCSKTLLLHESECRRFGFHLCSKTLAIGAHSWSMDNTQFDPNLRSANTILAF